MKKNMVWIILGTLAVVVLAVVVIILVGKVFMKPEEVPLETENKDFVVVESGERDNNLGMNHVTYDGYTELIALADTQEAAEEIASLYGIELKSFEHGVGVYITKENPSDVIKRGEENGWPTISLNTVIHLSPIENPSEGGVRIYKAE